MTLPFDEDSQDAPITPKIGLKKVSSQKSIFDGLSKKPSVADFEKQVHQAQERKTATMLKASELAVEFKKIINDRTLSQNKSPFAKELEKEILTKLVKMAKEVNADPTEPEGEGNLSCVVLLMNVVFSQRDRLNQLEYSLSISSKENSMLKEEIKNIKEEIKNNKTENK